MTKREKIKDLERDNIRIINKRVMRKEEILQEQNMSTDTLTHTHTPQDFNNNKAQSPCRPPGNTPSKIYFSDNILC